jgi:short-subunit dehydrogenase
MKLKNETALITGSTTGIGKQLAEILLKEGCKVAICSRSEENVKKTLSEFKEQFGDSVIGLPCDVNNPKDLKKIVDKTIEAFGSIRIMIANAGVNTIYGPFDCMDPEMVESNANAIIGANLIGTMNSIAAVLPQMNKQKYGRIITLSGGGADRPIDNMTIYSASKGGTVTFSKCLALELAEKEEDIKINIFQPGMLRTNLMTSFSCVPNWKSEEEIKENLEFILNYIDDDIEKRCLKVIPYILPETKSNGKSFRGFKLFKFIIRMIKMQREMKKRARKG